MGRLFPAHGAVCADTAPCPPPQPPLCGQLGAQHRPGSRDMSFIPDNTQPFIWLHPKGLCLGLETAMGAQPLQVGFPQSRWKILGEQVNGESSFFGKCTLERLNATVGEQSDNKMCTC